MHGGVLPEVALEAHGADTGVGAVQTLERRKRAVGRPVVDEDELERARARVEHADCAVVELLQRAGLVVERHDDGQVGRGQTGSRSAPALEGLRVSHGKSVSPDHSFEGRAHDRPGRM